ncbi:hypothetical protein E2C01_068473 [Portunus trituberculatus]|uniref:Uncharacterized protein n=1 Tax=Portunus trituberculatus TaxID=210409 RepID=A0A5B7HW81_PORTR|nr:hypothetical protein [Portunus trituberculatus]
MIFLLSASTSHTYSPVNIADNVRLFGCLSERRRHVFKRLVLGSECDDSQKEEHQLPREGKGTMEGKHITRLSFQQRVAIFPRVFC